MTLNKRIEGEMKRVQGALERVAAGVDSCRMSIDMGDFGALTESAVVVAQSSCQLFAHTSVLMALAGIRRR